MEEYTKEELKVELDELVDVLKRAIRSLKKIDKLNGITLGISSDINILQNELKQALKNKRR